MSAADYIIAWGIIGAFVMSGFLLAALFLFGIVQEAVRKLRSRRKHP
ncbi:hypothetical protein ACWCQZ_48490 [Streptomyces sp. NPDC002285]